MFFIDHMKKNRLTFLVLFIAGLMILLLPDDGEPVIKLNELHGPSWQDLIGLTLILFAWLFSCFIIVKNWKNIRSKVGQRNLILCLSIYVISVTGIFFSLRSSNEMLLWIFAVCAASINTLFIIFAFNKQ